MALSKISDSSGGIQIQNINQIPINLICEHCRNVVLDPVQLGCCGVRLCRWCSKKGLPDIKPFICRFCQTRKDKKQLTVDRGAQRELDKINVQCNQCSWNGTFQQYLQHLQENHANYECSDCHQRFFATNSYEEHREEICEFRSIQCPIPGCNELITFSQMQKHCLSTPHQLFLIQIILHVMYGKYHQDMTSEMVEERRKVLSGILERITAVLHELQTTIEHSERLKRERDQINHALEGNIAQINETVKIYNQGEETALSCIRSQNDASRELESVKRSFESAKISLLNTDGSIIFHFNLSDQIIYTPFSFDSPLFRTDTFGYVFTIRVCSTLPSNHLSIYLTLHRSPFDPILTYPFPYNMTISLCDQSGQEADIKVMIRADPASPAFARPNGERNPEVGVMNFCSLDSLTKNGSNYLKDGVFFIKVLFHFMDPYPSTPVI